MAQMGFFDLSDRYASLDAKTSPQNWGRESRKAIKLNPTFPKLDVFCSILSLRCARIKPFWHGLPWFGDLMRDLIALSGLEGRFARRSVFSTPIWSDL
jgi:hypothetical protein